MAHVQLVEREQRPDDGSVGDNPDELAVAFDADLRVVVLEHPAEGRFELEVVLDGPESVVDREVCDSVHDAVVSSRGELRASARSCHRSAHG
nr:hypothetical protein [Halorubrum sp. SD683]